MAASEASIEENGSASGTTSIPELERDTEPQEEKYNRDVDDLYIVATSLQKGAKKLRKLQKDIQRKQKKVKSGKASKKLKATQDSYFITLKDLHIYVPQLQPILDNTKDKTGLPDRPFRKTYSLNEKHKFVNRDKEELEIERDSLSCKNTRLTDENLRIKSEMTKLEEALKKSKADKKRLTETNADVAAQLAEAKKTIDQMKEEIERFSEIASSKLSDNPNITDLSDPNRPTKLAEDFSELYDNEWTDAYEELESSLKDKNEEQLVSYLLGFVLEIYKTCKILATEKSDTIELQLISPANGVELLPGMKKRIKDEIKSMAFSILPAVQEHIMDHIKAWSPWKEVQLESETVKKYIDKCTELCWYMSVQNPQLYMYSEPSKDGSFRHDIFKEYTKKGDKEAFVVWPILYLYEGGPMLWKGVAQGLDEISAQ
ncbi:hypothetical protein CHS0354_018687 [Potamilus streckersoni]|uniref:Mitochondria-eating protein n=1 Tax=Potamilus streckersoni TaxID=2493646 RepID=A0AAE0SKV3_9BIVA|nr:hypothetical protein CHS0354_018687 [Potamilus streckersoni]